MTDLRPLDAAAWLAAIVENSDDAILSKTLDGIITTWNPGASRLFGYTPDEAVGKPVTILIPEDRHSEEEMILRRLRAGERIAHFETVRRRKDGERIDISLSVSPVRNAGGQIIGASKIARDVTEAKRAQERQALLFREMQHRIKNLFAVVMSLINLSKRTATTSDGLVRDLSARVLALSRVHELTLPGNVDAGDQLSTTNLLSLLKAVVAPHDDDRTSRIEIAGCDVPLGGASLTSLALLFHELTTNAAKCGALSTALGHLTIRVMSTNAEVAVRWIETGGEAPGPNQEHQGFGTILEQSLLRSLGGSITREWSDDALVIDLRFPEAGFT